MSALIFVLAMFVSPGDAEALRETAPDCHLTVDAAREHIAAARVAGAMMEVDPDLLLSIAWHESRYMPATVTPERGGRESCGVMTPEPIARCTRGTLLDGYIAGARHVRTWLDATHDERTALTGYAGGYALIALCRRESARACSTWRVFKARASWIKRKRAVVGSM